MNGEPDVFLVEECVLNVSGVGKLPVSAFVLSLKHNGVPSLRATIDPVHKVEGAVYHALFGKPPEAEAVSVEVLIERYNKLQKIINGPDGRRDCSFRFKLKNDRALFGARRQELDLKNWVLVGAGLSSAASGGLSMQVEIKHPVHKLAETSANFFGMKMEEKIEPSTITGAPNVYESIVTCMNKFYEVLQDGVVEIVKNDTEFKEMVKQYQEARTNITKYLKWESDSGDWPTKPFQQFSDEIKYSMWQYVNATGDGTYWSWLSNTICNDWHVSIVPTFWDDKLEMSPNKYWREPDLDLLDISIMDFQLPPSDPMPLRGVYTYFDVPETQIGSLYNAKEGMQYSLANAVVWSEKVHRAMYMPMRVPVWFSSILLNRSGKYGSSTEIGKMVGDGMITSPMSSTLGQGGLGTPAVEDIKALYDGAKQLCKQQFTELFRASMEISIRANLMIQNDESDWKDKYVTAGMIVRIKPDATFMQKLIPGGAGDSLLDFFATEVAHCVDVQRKEAYTLFRGSFIREVTPPMSNIEAIPPGDVKNYLYE